MNRFYQVLGGVLVTLLGVLLVAGASNPIHQLIFSPTETSADVGLDSSKVDKEVIASDLDVPWEAEVTERGLLVPERTGDLLLVRDNETVILEEFGDLQDGFLGEGGLLGVAADPDFESNNLVYVYMTREDGEIENQVNRYRIENRNLVEEKTLIEGIPSHRIHNGGRIQFGPDEKLYITTGDAADPQFSQQKDSLAGKILRINRDGTVPESNPFIENETAEDTVYSYGHRNPQGITWDNREKMWSTEHGDVGNDEINLIRAGLNYGWPEIEGDQTHSEMESPVTHSGREETWAPAGAAYHEDSIFFGGLRGETLYQAKIKDEEVTEIISHFREDFGRIRAVNIENNSIYLTTSNTDGRGQERSQDDKVIRIDLEEFS